MNLILLHSDHRHVSAPHVDIFRVARTRILIYLQCIWFIPHLKIIKSGLKFQFNGETVIRIKY
jgi:hypothetical protein